MKAPHKMHDALQRKSVLDNKEIRDIIKSFIYVDIGIL